MSLGSSGVAEPLPEAEPLQFLARLEAEHLAVDLASRAQHNLAQHLDALGFGARVSLKGDVLGQPLYRLLIVPVAWCRAHSASRFLTQIERRTLVQYGIMPASTGQ